MSKIDDLEFDLEILRDVVYQIEQDMKSLNAELSRVKQLLQDTMRRHGVRSQPASKRRLH